jgi:biopolymer transport protein ExbD
MVQCPTCGEQTLVPLEDIFLPSTPATLPATPPPSPARPPATDLADDPGQTIDRPAAPGVSMPVIGHERLEAFEPVNPDTFQTMDDGRGASPIEAPQTDFTTLDDEERRLEQVLEEDETPPIPIRRRTRSDEEMDLTPMVDVTFQLLIFFMVTASFALQKSIDVPTPDPEKKGAAQQLQILEDLEGSSIRIQIDAANAIMIDEEPLGDPSRLQDALKDKMRKEQKTEILITAHSASLHRTVITVIDAANGVGMQKIRLVSRQGKSDQ